MDYILTKAMNPDQKYCYLVEHPRQGTKIFYDAYDIDKSARLAVDYAENLVTVFKLPLHDSAITTTQDLSAQFSSMTKPKVELPKLEPIEALLSSVG
jgi:hypothetical protein